MDPKPNLRDAAKAATRAKIIAAANALFEAGGYSGVGIRDIARAIGMSTGAVFANFLSKDALWTAVTGAPPPSPVVAEEIALIMGQFPGWEWSLNNLKGRHAATLISPDYDPLANTGTLITRDGFSPAGALLAVRAAASTHAVRPALELN